MFVLDSRRNIGYFMGTIEKYKIQIKSKIQKYFFFAFLPFCTADKFRVSRLIRLIRKN
jgi:hypothetical protein